MTNEISAKFDKLPAVDDIAGVIQDAFDVKLDISGGWGYDNNSALIVKAMDIPTDQFVHMFASMRATIEMNMILEEEARYAGVNANFVESKKFEINNMTYDILTFKITAMKEDVYAELIQEYKDNYGKKEFDMNDHFKRRNEATISREVDYWFVGLKE